MANGNLNEIPFTHLFVDGHGWENTIYTSADFEKFQLVETYQLDANIVILAYGVFDTGKQVLLKKVLPIKDIKKRTDVLSRITTYLNQPLCSDWSASTSIKSDGTFEVRVQVYNGFWKTFVSASDNITDMLVEIKMFLQS